MAGAPSATPASRSGRRPIPSDPERRSVAPYQPLSDEAWRRVTSQVREFMVWKRAGGRKLPPPPTSLKGIPTAEGPL
jgi:hypothetical protein